MPLYNPASSGASAPLTLTGSSDANQLKVVGNATQTSSTVLVEKSDGTDLLTLSNAGRLVLPTEGSSAGVRVGANVDITRNDGADCLDCNKGGAFASGGGNQVLIGVGNPEVTLGNANDTRIRRVAAGIARIIDAAQFEEISDPTAPAANNAILYAKDNGSAKTQLVVRFASGAVQVLATEP